MSVLKSEVKHTPDDGGPAFAALATSAMGDVYHQHGMSLRDWFAGQALAAIIQADDEIAYRRAATFAYLHADAMLLVRAEGR